MKMMKPSEVGAMLGLVLAGAIGNPVEAQPWVSFEDGESGSLCGVVNAAEDELAVLEDTGELIIVSGVDVIVAGTFVDLDNTVFIDGGAFGFIDFFEDADGFATLWWVIEPDLRVVGIDQFGGFYESDFFPEDFSDVACDACEFWDDPLDCDEDFDGVPDDFDLCLGTPPGEEVDEDGCSCFDYDSDADGIEDCFDLCPGTPPGEEVDEDGCSCFDYDSDADGVEDCFDLCPNTSLSAEVDVDGCPFRSDGGGTEVILCGAAGAPALGLALVAMLGLRKSVRRPSFADIGLHGKQALSQ